MNYDISYINRFGWYITYTDVAGNLIIRYISVYNIGIPMVAKTWLSDKFQYIMCYTDGAYNMIIRCLTDVY
jgi:hypothetical protein